MTAETQGAGQNRDNKKRGLGRGLGALITDTSHPTNHEATEASHTLEIESDLANAAGVWEIELALIRPNPKQPRSHFDEETLAELAGSIREHGIIQPLILTEDSRRSGHYWLIAGERRWRAAQQAGLQKVPAIVRESSTQQMVELALIENIQRADLNSLEEAVAYYTLMKEFSLTHEQVAVRVCKSRSAITNTLRLLQLPTDAQKALIVGRISAGHARALLSLPDHETMSSMLNQIIVEGLNVRQTEAAVKALLLDEEDVLPIAEEDGDLDTDDVEAVDDEILTQVEQMEDGFRTAFGTKVNLRRRANGSGTLVVHFFNDDDLQNIYELVARE